MDLIYEKGYIMKHGIETDFALSTFMHEVNWLRVTEARFESFMALEKLEYSYGSGTGRRTYNAKLMNYLVEGIMEKLNTDFNTSFDICFLNRYDNEKMALGWHADDSPEIDPDHPIAVVSVGAEREIWVKPIGFKGEIPDENKYMLHDGSLFMMPAGYQKTNLHKIPKWSVPCDTRISLTYRKFKKPS